MRMVMLEEVSRLQISPSSVLSALGYQNSIGFAEKVVELVKENL